VRAKALQGKNVLPSATMSVRKGNFPRGRESSNITTESAFGWKGGVRKICVQRGGKGKIALPQELLVRNDDHPRSLPLKRTTQPWHMNSATNGKKFKSA